jgi:hypothetical protein
MTTCINMNTIKTLIDELETHCLAAVPVGSRVTVNPPPMDTDCDILCRCDDYDAFDNFYNYLLDKGWKEEGEYGEMEFWSYRKKIEETPYNLIVTFNEEFFDKFLEATVKCKKLNLQTKGERVELFDKVMGRKKKPPKMGGWASGLLANVTINNYNQQFMAALAAQQPAANPYAAGLQANNIHDAVYYDLAGPVVGNEF